MTSTSKIKLLLGGMIAPKPASPYARLDGMYNFDFSPTHIPVDKRKVHKKIKKKKISAVSAKVKEKKKEKKKKRIQKQK